MANTKSAKKRVRVNERNRVRNRVATTQLRGAIKRYRAILATGDAPAALAALSQVHSAIDRGARKGVITSNTGKRYKSRLALAQGRLTTGAGAP